MLVLSRKKSERIRIETPDGFIWLTIIEVRGDKVRVGIEADKVAKVMREELLPADEQYFAGMTASAQ